VHHQLYTLISFRGCFLLVKEGNKRISVTVSENIYIELAEEASYEDRSISNMVLKIIKDHYKIQDDE
jgi:hypothetical protein